MGYFGGRSPKIGLALGGGGARGGIHIGVLKALEDNKIPIHCIAGTSIGAIIGGFYALSPDARGMEKRLLEYLESETFRKSRVTFSSAGPHEKGEIFARISSFIKKEYLLHLALSRPYIFPRDYFRENLTFFLKDTKIEEARIPFAAVATDLESGEEVIIHKGSMIDAVYASITYPGVVEAVRLGGRLLIDGGVTSQIPVNAARKLGAEVVIAVNPDRQIVEHIKDLSGVEILFRADDIMGTELARRQAREAEVLIYPGLGDGKWYEFERMPEYIPLGEKAIYEKLPEILEIIRKKKGLRRLWKGRR
jgi:NTE family protein